MKAYICTAIHFGFPDFGAQSSLKALNYENTKLGYLRNEETILEMLPTPLPALLYHINTAEYILYG